MLVRDLITRLHTLIYDHENGGRYHKGVDMLGECEIHIDVFRQIPQISGGYTYQGVSPNINIDRSGDGVFHILSAFEAKEEEKV